VLIRPFQIYATSEERKQRNRQAQAAFRERRTEYIKQLEITLKQNEETIQNLRRSNRSATEECHLLRYRNSLLERIMIEKGKASCMSLIVDCNMLTNTHHRLRCTGRNAVARRQPHNSSTSACFTYYIRCADCPASHAKPSSASHASTCTQA